MGKNMVLATVLGLLLFGTQVPAEASTVESALGSQVELVEVMHRMPPPPHGDWRHVPPKRNDHWRDRDRHHDDWRTRDRVVRRPHVPHFPMPRR